MPINMGRLSKLLAVALSSDQPGEMANALRLVRRHLKANDRDIHWLIDQFNGAPHPVLDWSQKPERAPFENNYEPSWVEMHDWCKQHYHLLSWKEKEFVGSLDYQRFKKISFEPTPRQRSWLKAIHNKYRY